MRLASVCGTTGVSDSDFGHDDENGRYVQYEMTFPFNLFSACPALSLPSGFSSGGLPSRLPSCASWRPANSGLPRWFS
jgi:Asp-tRNA(Asn)/Glu-tRNA(Gln) amidotransferase A subunit family amidase